MRKWLFLLLCSLSASAQYTFDKGYYVTNDGQRIDGYIKNESWKNNPVHFEFRSNPEAASSLLDVTNVTEFGVGNEITFKRLKVKIDRASDEIRYMRKSRYPEFKEETLFLELLVKGKATLYAYSEGTLFRYFIETATAPTEQLVYLRYIDPKTTDMGTNNGFQQQLANIAPRGLSESKMKNLKYQRSELINYVMLFNGQDPKTYQTRKAIVQEQLVSKHQARSFRDMVTVRLAAGIGTSKATFTIPQSGFYAKTETSLSGTGYAGGVEFEFFPVKRKAFSVIVNPTYYTFKSDGNYVVNRLFYNAPENRTIAVDYTAIDLSLGVRYGFFATPNAKIYVNAAFAVPASHKTKITNNGSQLDASEGSVTLSAGVGFAYKRLSVELRGNSVSTILEDNVSFLGCKVGRTALFLGYNLW